MIPILENLRNDLHWLSNTQKQYNIDMWRGTYMDQGSQFHYLTIKSISLTIRIYSSKWKERIY